MKNNQSWQKILNKNNFSGRNIGAMLAVVFVALLALLAAWVGITTHSALLVVLIVVVASLTILPFISIMNKLTLSLIRKKLSAQNQAVKNYVFCMYQFKDLANNQAVSFSDLGGSTIDVILAINDEHIYFMPTFYYTKHPIIVILKKDLLDINFDKLRITRDSIDDWNNAHIAANKGLPVNQINKSLDQALPLDRMKLAIRTKGDEYRFLIHKRDVDRVLHWFEPEE